VLASLPIVHVCGGHQQQHCVWWSPTTALCVVVTDVTCVSHVSHVTCVSHVPHVNGVSHGSHVSGVSHVSHVNGVSHGSHVML
jgi:hypothetical protein